MTRRTPASAAEQARAARATRNLMAAALLAALAIVLVIYWGPRFGLGTSSEKLPLALRATARWSFLWFMLASTGAALHRLFGARFATLAGRGRDFGLAFASAHLAHVGLVAWLYIAYTGPGIGSLVFFGVALFFTYLLALLSIPRLHAALDPRVWWAVRTVGIEYINYAFFTDFATNPFKGGALHAVAYLPFLALTIAGPLLRIAAAVQKFRLARLGFQ
jgi:hypothetical protein